MLRYLVAVAAVVVGFALFVAIQDERATKHHAQEAADANKQVVAPPNHAQPHDSVYNPEWDTPRWYGIFRWSTGITTWGILLTLVALVEQTRHTGKAAEAALLNAQAVVNAERALLLFTFAKSAKQGNQSALFLISVHNYGKVPARTIGISKPTSAYVSLAAMMSKLPNYGHEFEQIEEYLAPAEESLIAVFPVPTKAKSRSNTHGSNAWGHIIYGEVTYCDGISSEQRHSRYCFLHEYNWGDPNDTGGMIKPFGTPKHLECT